MSIFDNRKLHYDFATNEIPTTSCRPKRKLFYLATLYDKKTKKFFFKIGITRNICFRYSCEKSAGYHYRKGQGHDYSAVKILFYVKLSEEEAILLEKVMREELKNEKYHLGFVPYDRFTFFRLPETINIPYDNEYYFKLEYGKNGRYYNLKKREA